MAKYVRLDEVDYPDGNRSVDYDYGTAGAIDDIMSRLATIGDGTDTYASYKYLGVGRIVEEDYEDVEVKLSYLESNGNVSGLDRFGRVADQVWTDYGADPDVVLDRYTYTYDRAGNRTSRDNELHSAFDEDYTYDDLGRLTDADRADSFDQSWGLDGLGNFSTFDDDGTSQSRTTNAANEITGITGTWIDPTYDDAGNMISGPKTGNETTRLHHVYDDWNRQTGIYQDDGDGTFEPGTDDDLVATYEYDGVNRRIEKTFTDDTGVEYFYNSDWQMLEERAVDDEGTPTGVNQYVWSARYIDAPVLRFHDANADGDVLDAGDNTRYYTGDANYKVTATIDAATGEVVDRYVYTAYGQATVYDEDWANPAAPATDGPLYAGYFFDAETRLYQVRNRYYDSSLSTFISRDPIGYEGGINLYEYVGDNPLIRTDPNGLDFQTWCGMRYCPPPPPDPNAAGLKGPTEEEVAACCATARKSIESQKLGYSGTVACCKGQKVSCEWASELPVIKKIGGALQAITKKCAMAHEGSHSGDMPDGVCKDVPDGGFPKCPKDWDQDKSECSALAASLKCFKDNNKDCKGDKRCEWGIDVWVKNQEAQMKTLECEKKYRIKTP